MSPTDIEEGEFFASDYLQHYGVKGMRWGVRRRPAERIKVRTSHEPGKKVKAKGGTGQRASDDAVRTAVYKQKAKKSTTDALSNKELKALVSRMQLEQQYSAIAPKPPSKAVTSFLAKHLTTAGNQQASRVANDMMAQQVNEYLKKNAK